MATDEHKQLASIIKTHHSDLRQRSKVIGADAAWREHLNDTEKLQEYAEAMRKLASIWEINTNREDMNAFSRVKWIANYCYSYFFTESLYLQKREREKRLLESWSRSYSNCEYLQQEPENIRLLDVGSCFNPFKDVPRIEVCAIDISPANENVLRGDFLQMKVSSLAECNNIDFAELPSNNEVSTLPRNYFHCVVFSLLLEYIPSSAQRIECCLKAYDLLGPEGILIVVTPDSQNVGKNASIMKTWRYTLATFGFMRIKFEKLSHITCMVFRKSMDPYLSKRWAELHREDYMKLELKIPQDVD